MNTLFMAVVIIVAAVVMLKLFSLPVRWFFRLLLSTIVGFVFLLIINYIGAFIGLALGLNILNALIIGVLGLPGVILLLVLQFI